MRSLPSVSGTDTTVGSVFDTVTSPLVNARPAIVPAIGWAAPTGPSTSSCCRRRSE